MAFVAHDRPSWPLPLYEAALMSATLAAEAGRTPQLTIVTPESRPLEVFGEHAGRQMEDSALLTFSRARSRPPCFPRRAARWGRPTALNRQPHGLTVRRTSSLRLTRWMGGGAR